jgi:putative transposase
VHRSTYKYWLARDDDICPEQVRLISEIRLAHNDSNGSAGARAIADIATQGAQIWAVIAQVGSWSNLI